MALDTLSIVHHTHTDVGFTNDQPIFWELQYRFNDDALRLIDHYAGNPPESRFRWTVETTCGINAWLKTATSRAIDRLLAADRAGLLEIMAMQTNITPLLDTAQLIDGLRPVQRLRRDYGLDIRHAMNCDVNGQNWTLADLLLERDALADFSHFVPRSDATDLLVFNPLPWTRTISGCLAKNILIPRGLGDDATASRHFLGRMAQPTDFWTGRAQTDFHGGMGWLLAPTTVPALGYAVVGWDAHTDMASTVESDVAIIENQRYRLTFDTLKGGITSLFDKQLNREWVDASAGYPLHGFVHEEVADHDAPEPRKLLCTVNWIADTATERGWHPDWQANRSSRAGALLHKVYRLPFATVVEQILEHALIGKIYPRVLLPDSGGQIEFQSEWQMGATIHPEATYLLFPFHVPDAQVRFDVGGVPVRPHLDQLAGSCRDFFTVQGWVDFNNGEHGVTIAAPENPMVQLGNFHFARDQSEVNPERALLLGWVTNNYWETNFPGVQPGVVTARYVVQPYSGEFDEARAHRLAAEVAHARPLIQHLGEPAAPELLPAARTLLHLPQPPVLTLSQRAAPDGGARLTLFNASDAPQTAVVSSRLVRIRSAQVCDAFGDPLETLSVKDGSVEVTIAPRLTAALHMK